MSQIHPYILVRVDADGKPFVVHSTEKMKDARYWLQYIAQPGDAILMTSSHEKYSGDGTPLYQAHLVSRGKIEYSEELWKKQVAPNGALALSAEIPKSNA